MRRSCFARTKFPIFLPLLSTLQNIKLHLPFFPRSSRKCRSPFPTLLFVKFERGNQCFRQDSSEKGEKEYFRKNGCRDKCETFFAIVSLFASLEIRNRRIYTSAKSKGKRRGERTNKRILS